MRHIPKAGRGDNETAENRIVALSELRNLPIRDCDWVATQSVLGHCLFEEALGVGRGLVARVCLLVCSFSNLLTQLGIFTA